MFFRVRDLELRKAHFDVTYPAGELEFDPKLRQLTPLQCEGTAELLGNTLGEIRVKGKLSVTMGADCDRCLEPAEMAVAGPFDLFFRPDREDGERADEVEIDDGESQVGFYVGDGLALEDVLREQVLLSLPMQRVCREACKGICPICGRNRNVAACQCSAKPADDRWAALKNLK